LFDRILKLFRHRCPVCGERALRFRNGYLATCVNEQGTRYPSAYNYESCDSCGSRVKRFINGRVEIPTEEEWRSSVDSIRREK
jgi:hypothetical protein